MTLKEQKKQYERNRDIHLNLDFYRQVPPDITLKEKIKSFLIKNSSLLSAHQGGTSNKSE